MNRFDSPNARITTLSAIFFSSVLISPGDLPARENEFGAGSVLLAADGSGQRASPHVWSNIPSKNPPDFYYPNPMRPYMRRLNETYGISRITADARTDLDRVKVVCDWVHQQWRHYGNCPPQKNDPIGILEAAKAGAKFSCYEYSMVTAACLNSIRIKSRFVVILPQDIESRPEGNYHVVTEAYLNDRKKWVMVDAQWNAMPSLNNYPLSIAELQNALAKGLPGIDFGNLPEESLYDYAGGIGQYLFYFYTPLDNRVIGASSPANIGGGVMLVPMGARPPSTFAGAPINRFSVTNSIPDFYGAAKP